MIFITLPRPIEFDYENSLSADEDYEEERPVLKRSESSESVFANIYKTDNFFDKVSEFYRQKINPVVHPTAQNLQRTTCLYWSSTLRTTCCVGLSRRFLRRFGRSRRSRSGGSAKLAKNVPNFPIAVSLCPVSTTGSCSGSRSLDTFVNQNLATLLVSNNPAIHHPKVRNLFQVQNSCLVYFFSGSLSTAREMPTAIRLKPKRKRKTLKDQISELEQNLANSQAEITNLKQNFSTLQGENTQKDALIQQLQDKVRQIPSAWSSESSFYYSENQLLVRAQPRDCLHRGTNYVFPKRSQDVEDQTDDQQSEELSEPISSKRQLKRKSTYKKRTSRVTFTDERNQLLLAVFNENPYPSIDQRNKLADENNLTESQIVYTEEQTMSSQNVYSTSIARRTRKAPAPDASKGPNSKRRALADSSQSEPEVDLRESRHKRGSVRCVTYNDSDSDFDDSPVKRKSRNTRKNKADSKKDAPSSSSSSELESDSDASDVEDQTDDQQSEELSEPISSKQQLKRKSTYKKRTSRVTFTDEQNQLLLAVFNENPYPSIDQRNKLADENNLTESQVFPIKSRLRFQLFRSKLRRKLRCFNFNKTTMRSEFRKNRHQESSREEGERRLENEDGRDQESQCEVENGIRQMREEKEQLEVTLMDRVNKKIGDRNGYAYLAPGHASFTTTRDAKSSPVAPRRHLRSADASTIIQRGTGTQGTPATSTTNQIASRRRSPTGPKTQTPEITRRRSPLAKVPPQPSPARPAQPSSSEDTQKPKKAPRKRPAPYKAFGCPCRRYSKDSAKQSSEVAAASTTLASSGGRGRGRVATGATTGRAKGNASTAPSSRGRGKSSATNAPTITRKRGSQISSSTGA
ncbi:hypothetical protein L5515_017363 [Caenorhabditis briggsae]|uniref:Homeobox domain-containing protein n=1 Tax=Caenorhabditis briggsae TaxID=6238 RepID=A0AAE9FEC9_CAEBR|nr:hypothetical protein L5515_017363 [Caenorhabditis briggsae]